MYIKQYMSIIEISDIIPEDPELNIYQLFLYSLIISIILTLSCLLI